jgi:hypothetical protein
MKKIILVAYFIFLILVTAFSYLFVDANLIYLRTFYTGFALTQREVVTLVYALIILFAFIFYFVFLNNFRMGTFTIKEFKLILGGSVFIMLFSYPAMVSYDIFNYIATAKVAFLYHENPYLIMPIQFTGDPLLLFTHAANKTALYGPVWILLTGVPFLLSFGNFFLTLLSFKFLNIIFFLGTIFVIYRYFSKNLYQLAFFAFNPLVILEILLGSHNDIVMMFFAFVSIYFLRERKIVLSLIFIVLSILIKFSTIFLLPVFIVTLIYYFMNKKINWEKFYLFSSLLMLVIFLLSPLREEIYPWYAVWFLSFVPFIKIRLLKYIYLTFSFSLLLRDLPFMLLGTYSAPTPMIKIMFTFIPVLVVVSFIYVRKLWLEKRYH